MALIELERLVKGEICPGKFLEYGDQVKQAYQSLGPNVTRKNLYCKYFPSLDIYAWYLHSKHG
jgi:hypothetical protein